MENIDYKIITLITLLEISLEILEEISSKLVNENAQ